MKLRPFGKTGLQVSEVAFGGGRSGGILINASEEKRREAVMRALDLGVNWFDTAPQYGDGKSEEALGTILTEIREKPMVSSKVRIDLNLSESIVSQVERSAENSLRRLELDRIDLLLIHSPITTTASGRTITVDHVLRYGGIADSMEKLRDLGIINFMGLTALGDNLSTIEVINSGRFDAAQVYYNLINPSSSWKVAPQSWSSYDGSGIMNACIAQGMAIMAIRVFAASYLATKVRTGRESILTENTHAESEASNTETVFSVIGSQFGTRAQTALRFVLSNKAVSTAIIGLSEIRHLDEACKGAEKGPLSEETNKKLWPFYDRGFT